MKTRKGCACCAETATKVRTSKRRAASLNFIISDDESEESSGHARIANENLRRHSRFRARREWSAELQLGAFTERMCPPVVKRLRNVQVTLRISPNPESAAGWTFAPAAGTPSHGKVW